MDRISLLIPSKKISEKYFDALKFLSISVFCHYVLFLIIQFIDFITELFTFHEEVFMFYILRNIFFALNLISIILFITINFLYISSTMDDKKEDMNLPKNFLSFIKLNITLFIIWTILLFGTAFPRIFLLMTNGEIIGGFTKVLIYMKMPLIVSIYLHAYVIYTIYKEIMKMVEEFGLNFID